MKYVIIGVGGTGGTVGYYMTKAGKDVTLIARGRTAGDAGTWADAGKALGKFF